MKSVIPWTVILKTHLILYVADQGKSTAFYAEVLDKEPTLEVPGMTEFQLGRDTVLGLMPEAGMRRLLGSAITGRQPNGTELRAELYLLVEQPDAYHLRAIAAGARELSPLNMRDWGHYVAYSRDLDGYVLAFALDPTGPPS